MTVCGNCGFVVLIRSIMICPKCHKLMWTWSKNLREKIPISDMLDNYIGTPAAAGVTKQTEVEKMPELGAKVKTYPDQAKEAGIYSIQQGSYTPQQTRNGRALILDVKREGDPSGKHYSLFVPYYDEPSNRTNLATLLGAWGSNTDKWVGKKIKVEKNKETGKAVLSAM